MEQIPDVDLSVAGLRSAAEAETNLTDWGREDFVEPLTIYLASAEESANFHAQGRYVLWKTFMRLLTNRLRITHDLASHPEILSTEIPRPLYILGLPRTGTTLLHNLLSCDPAARYIHLWEGLFPSPPPTTETIHNDPRIKAAHEMVGLFNQLAPKLASAHHLNPTGPEECLWLLEHTFVDFIHELRAHVPAYSDWLSQHEASAAPYREYLQMLQLLSWKCPGKHWVFKAPRHLMALSGLLEVVPDARIVQTHRDPAEVIPSLCSLCEIDRQIFTSNPDKHLIGDFWLNRLKNGLATAQQVRDNDSPERYVDVHYRELIQDPLSVVQQIYQTHDYEYTDAFEAAMKTWLANNRQHKHGTHHYTLEEYGLQRSQIESGFADYRHRHAL